MEKETKDSPERRRGKYGPWDMLRDVLTAAISHGQFSTVLAGLAAITAILWLSHSDWATYSEGRFV